MDVLIVLNFNDSDTTAKFLDSISGYRSIDKIVVVDNCSTDGSFESLQKYTGPKVDVIRTQKNGGYAFGNNFGVKYAESVYPVRNIIISNPDVSFSEEDIEKICYYLNEYNDVAVATGVMCSPNGKPALNFALKMPKYSDLLADTFRGIRFVRRRIFGKSNLYDSSVVQSDTIIDVDIVQGSFFAIKDSVFRTLDYFDESTFLYFEELILADKLKNAGYRSVVLTSVKYLHHHAVSINKSVKRQFARDRIYQNSCEYFMSKYMNTSRSKIALYTAFEAVGKYERWLLEKAMGLRRKR